MKSTQLQGFDLNHRTLGILAKNITRETSCRGGLTLAIKLFTQYNATDSLATSFSSNDVWNEITMHSWGNVCRSFNLLTHRKSVVLLNRISTEL